MERPMEYAIDCANGYDAWLSSKVSETMARVASGQTRLHECRNAIALLKIRLESRVSKAEQVRGFS